MRLGGSWIRGWPSGITARLWIKERSAPMDREIAVAVATSGRSKVKYRSAPPNA